MIGKFKKMINSLFNTTPVKEIPPDLEHAVMGMVTEAAEVMDILKKWRFYGKAYMSLTLKEELGDLLFYVQAGAKAVDSSLEELMEFMIAKHGQRYPDGNFSTGHALERDKVAEWTAMKAVERKYDAKRKRH